ncbi:MAG: CxxC-x17-CxxC domain-containing protein [Candidatus Paceibacterota bacterium]|jgi:CxxC-x17-CxxC domain-containing protein|nr:hypothetical protein [bacterium]
MKNFDKIAKRGKNNGLGQGNSRRNFENKFGDKERPQMYDAICSDCGKKCEVPFKPSNDKSVYCSRCFSVREESGNDRSNRKVYEGAKFPEKTMFNTICDKCGKRFEISFKPTGDRPVYCSECFDKGGSVSRNNDKLIKEQLEVVNIKLDKILRILSSANLITNNDVIEGGNEERAVEKKVKIRKIKKTIDKKSIGKKKKAVKK